MVINERQSSKSLGNTRQSSRHLEGERGRELGHKKLHCGWLALQVEALNLLLVYFL